MVRNNEHMSEKVNLSPLGITVLIHLARSPTKQYYVREIARIIKGSVGGCHKVLKNLFEMGLIEKKMSGRNLYYKIKERNPAIKFFKIFINIQELNYEINEIYIDCKKITLFGSCSTGDDTLESDIDILVITENVNEINNRIKNRNINGRKLKPIVLLPHNLIKLKDKDPGFYREINKGIILWRDYNE